MAFEALLGTTFLKRLVEIPAVVLEVGQVLPASDEPSTTINLSLVVLTMCPIRIAVAVAIAIKETSDARSRATLSVRTGTQVEER